MGEVGSEYACARPKGRCVVKGGFERERTGTGAARWKKWVWNKLLFLGDRVAVM